MKALTNALVVVVSFWIAGSLVSAPLVASLLGRFEALGLSSGGYPAVEIPFSYPRLWSMKDEMEPQDASSNQAVSRSNDQAGAHPAIPEGAPLNDPRKGVDE